MIQGISEADQTISLEAMSDRQQALAAVVLKDPAVESLSSFIGIDGMNTTMNSGRILIDLKPLNDRGIDASGVIGRLTPELAKVAGIRLYMQPVQDITVETRVSRTQFQYSLEDPNTAELNSIAPKMVARLSALPELTDVASDQQTGGLRTTVVFDRDTAARLMVDAAFYDASVANYRQAVLTAFQQVEDNLAALRILERESAVEADAVQAAQDSLRITTEQYRTGVANYLQVLTAQNSVLNTQAAAISILTRRINASVLLVEALGGGWNASQLPSRADLRHR